MTLKQNIVSMMAMPGKVIIGQKVVMNSRPVLRIDPHSGVGGWTPSPMKDRPEIIMILVPIRSVESTIRGESVLAKICRMMMRKFPDPLARAASTYS